MQTRIRGLAERRGTLYLVADGSIVELDEPREAVLHYQGRQRRLSPPAALYPLVGRPALISTGPSHVIVRSGHLAAAVRSGSVIVERAVLAASRSLQLAGRIAETLVPGIAYYDAVWRSPGLAVPWWAQDKLADACKTLPMLSC